MDCLNKIVYSLKNIQHSRYKRKMFGITHAFHEIAHQEQVEREIFNLVIGRPQCYCITLKEV